MKKPMKIEEVIAKIPAGESQLVSKCLRVYRTRDGKDLSYCVESNRLPDGRKCATFSTLAEAQALIETLPRRYSPRKSIQLPVAPIEEEDEDDAAEDTDEVDDAEATRELMVDLIDALSCAITAGLTNGLPSSDIQNIKTMHSHLIECIDLVSDEMEGIYPPV